MSHPHNLFHPTNTDPLTDEGEIDGRLSIPRTLLWFCGMWALCHLISLASLHIFWDWEWHRDSPLTVMFWQALTSFISLPLSASQLFGLSPHNSPHASGWINIWIIGAMLLHVFIFRWRRAWVLVLTFIWLLPATFRWGLNAANIIHF